MERLVAADSAIAATAVGRSGADASTRLKRRSAPEPAPGVWGIRASLGPGLALPTGTYADVVGPSLLVTGRLGAERTRDGSGIGPGLHFNYVRWSLGGQFEQALATRETSTSGSTTHVGVDIRRSLHGKRFVAYAAAGLGIDWNRWSNTDEDGAGLGVELGAGADVKVGRRPAVGVALIWHPATSSMVSVPNAVRVGYLALQAVGSLY